MIGRAMANSQSGLVAAVVVMGLLDSLRTRASLSVSQTRLYTVCS